MRVLLDHCVPKKLGRLLVDHFVRTAATMDWSELKNGALLLAAADQFDVVVTVDKSLRFQQHTGDLPIAVISLVARHNKLKYLEPLVPQVLKLLGSDLQRQVYVVGEETDEQ